MEVLHQGTRIIIIANIIPPDHVDDLPVVELNQPDDVLVIPEPVLVDEDEDPEEEEFEEEEEPQEEEDMDIDDKEDENKPELTFPYEEADPLNLPPPTSESEPKDVIEDGDRLLPGFMRRDIDSLFEKGKAKDKYYGKLIADLGNEVRSSVEEGAAAMENLVSTSLGNAEERNECKKLTRKIMPPKFASLNQAAVRRMIKESVDAAIAAKRARQANAGNNASGSEQARGQVTAPVVRECTFAGFMKCN
ncbi:hypothetical protein Tco_0408711 [Tanacetum coccineum]